MTIFLYWQILILTQEMWTSRTSVYCTLLRECQRVFKISRKPVYISNANCVTQQISKLLHYCDKTFRFHNIVTIMNTFYHQQEPDRINCWDNRNFYQPYYWQQILHELSFRDNLNESCMS